MNSIQRLKVLMGHSFFPTELVPGFSSRKLADILDPHLLNLLGGFTRKSSKSCGYSIPKLKHMRRQLGIPNPLHQLRLSHVIAEEWGQLSGHIDASPLSLSKPVFKGDDTRLSKMIELSQISKERVLRATNSKFMLHTDITRFYSTVYTHSIPWALHTKQTAKSNRGPGLLGNKIDELIRRTQDDQTMGIPIGPDTSLVVAELIGSVIDQRVNVLDGLKDGFRYLDDFFLFFASKSQAESALADLHSIVREFELDLNSEKTRIIELPEPLEPEWVSEMRLFSIGKTGARSKQIVSYFSKAFALQKRYPSDFVLLYALNRSRRFSINEESWDVYQSMVLNIILAEPHAIRIAGDILLDKYAKEHFKLDIEKIKRCIIEYIGYHSKYGNGMELSWALWFAKMLCISLEGDVVRHLSKVDDVSTALIALDMRDKGQLNDLDTSNWESWCNASNLYNENWLFAYEASVKGWLPSTNDYITQDDFFSILKSNSVEFYDGTAVRTTKQIDDKRKDTQDIDNLLDNFWFEATPEDNEESEDEDYIPDDISFAH